ncbi:uncharacterized protein Obp83cd [Eurosta solidaginis]|uniref:uncharacterized protein Obp83cd n=1 Tax=Eurosta solidaginis TaxID=178769 RepID=UPI0035305E55
MKFSIFLLFSGLVLSPVSAIVKTNIDESRIIAECLKSYGGLTEENAQRLVRFKEWSEDYEEIPCFSKCYLKNMFDIYDDAVGFKEEQVTRQFGQVLYNACRHRMAPLPNKCVEAYHGFNCLVNLEDDPFVLIESMANVSTQAKMVMRDCLHLFDQYQWERMKEYKKKPVREPIPCFTKCFIHRLKVYHQQKLQWNIPALRTHLGVPKAEANIQHCFALRRNGDICAWMYQEFTCFGLAST